MAEVAAEGTPPFTAVILAAGKGTRMKSSLPKVLHPVLGKPMVWHVLRAVRRAGASRIIAVVGYGADRVREALAGEGVEFVHQDPPLGTGHAVMQAAPLLGDGEGTVLVACGDMPLLRAETLQRLVAGHLARGAAATVLSARVPDPTGYGRIIRDDGGSFVRIVEERDGSPEELAVREVNTGTYCFAAGPLLDALARLRPDNVQGEYYLTDVPGILASAHTVEALELADPWECRGINSRWELAQAEEVLQERIIARWGEAGVTVRRPATVTIETEVRLEPGCEIGPGTALRGDTEVAAGARIGPDAELIDCKVGAGARIWGVRLRGCTVEAGAAVCPGVTLPDGAAVASGAVVGRGEKGGPSAGATENAKPQKDQAVYGHRES